MARYRKVDPRIWNDAKFSALSDNGKLTFLFVMTHPHMTAVGAMRGTISGLAEELGWTKKAFEEAFAEGLSKGMFKHDPKSCFIGLPNFIRYNRPENPNVVIGWAKAWELVPECSLKDELYYELKGFTEGLSKAFAKAFAESFETPLPKQEQEQEQEQEQDKDTRSSVPDDRFDDFWDIYPRKVKKADARKKWKSRKLDLKADEIIADVQARVVRDGRWLEGYVPDPTTYINGSRWDDEIEPPRGKLQASSVPHWMEGGA